MAQAIAQTLTATIDGIALVAKLFPPTGEDKNILLFCLPGGGLTRDYFDLTDDYSFTDRMTALGYSVITIDHPGIATNALPADHPYYTPRQAARYLSQALEIWRDGNPVIGIGHSMGGMVTMIMQGNHSPFIGLGLFGSNAGGLDWGLSENEKRYINQQELLAKDLEAVSLAKFGGPFTRAGAGPSGKSITFSGETPALTERLREISCRINSAAAMMSMTRGSFHTEVNAIDVPLFFVFGDHDIGIPPKDVPKDFPNAHSIELTVLKQTGHNHFAFKSIETLCNKLDYWASDLVTSNCA